jgi:hypothetical protein
MVVLPVARSPMISSRWPRPIGIIASIDMMPVCTGTETDFRLMMPGAIFPSDSSRRRRCRPCRRSAGPSALTTRPSSASPTGTESSLPVVRHSEPSLDRGVVAEQHDADFAFLKVEGHAGDAAAELDHFVEHDVGKPFDFADAVADLTDGADIGFFDGGGDSGDLLFEFLEDAAHGERLLVVVLSVFSKRESESGGEAVEAALTEPSKTSLPTRMRRPPRRAGLTWYCATRSGRIGRRGRRPPAAGGFVEFDGALDT